MHELEITSNATVRTYFETKYVPSNLNLSDTAAEQYRIALRQLDKFNSVPVKLTELSESLVLGFVRWCIASGRSERTANNKRQAVLTLWRHAANETKLISAPPKIAKVIEPGRIVQAWTIEEVSRLLDAVAFCTEVRGWDARHWRALILVIYDTSHRIGAVLKATRDALDMRRGTLLLKAEWTKQKRDILHKLHPDTLAALSALPQTKSPLLFCWPLRRRAIWDAFRMILAAAGLRATRKDLFHKLRRTSFTYVFALLGEQAARDHAGHATNLTASYLDKQLLSELRETPSPVDVLPRPK